MDLTHAVEFEYNEVLVGRKSLIPIFFFGQSDMEAEIVALKIFRYAFDKYLGWSPEELRDNLNMEIIENLKLTQVLRYIEFPPEFDSKKDLFYVVWKLYPETANISLTEQVLRIYDKVLSKKMAKFPKEYFNGNEGRIKACICLNYMVNEFMTFDSIEELYAIFASSEISKIFQEYRMTALCRSLFVNPVDFLHTMLPDNQKIDFLYYFYSFELELAADERKKKREKKKAEEQKRKEKKECERKEKKL